MSEDKNPVRPSNMGRAYMCPPSPWRSMEHSGPSFDGDLVDANEGSKLHAAVVKAYCMGEWQGLNDEQVWAVRYCIREFEPYVSQAQTFFERPISPSFLERSCTPDLVMIISDDAGKRYAKLYDWKFGRKPIAEEAGKDWQMISYAVAVARHYNVDRVEVLRFHPRLFDDNRRSDAVFAGDTAYWEKWEKLLSAIAQRSKPESQAYAGEHCLYCRAKVSCNEFVEWADPLPDQLPALSETTPAVKIDVARVAQILDYSERVKMLQSMITTARKLAVKAMEDGIDVPGWKIKPPRKVREIMDVPAAYMELSQHLSGDAINEAITMSVPKLVDAIKVAEKITKREAEAKVEAVIGQYINVKEGEYSVERARN